MGEKPLVSIVVTSYIMDRLEDIYDLLHSIESQTYSNIEVIFVIERSVELYETIKSYCIEKVKITAKVVFSTEPGLSPARNIGVKLSSGEIIGFVDDDVILFPDWVETMIRTFDNSNFIGVTGPAFPKWEDESMKWLPEEFYWIISCTAWFDDSRIREVRNAWGHSMAFRKTAFDTYLFTDTFGRTEGADKAGKKGPVGDDTEFSMNLRNKTGKAIVYNPGMKVWHKVYKFRLKPSFIKRQAYWQGYTKAMFKKLYKDDGVKGSGVLSTEYKLLQQILVKLPVKIAKEFFKRPNIAWRKTSLTIRVLYHLSLGYFSAVSPVLRRFTENSYR